MTAAVNSYTALHLAAKNITPQLSGVLNVLSDFRSLFEGTLSDAQKAGREWGQVVSAIHPIPGLHQCRFRPVIG